MDTMTIDIELEHYYRDRLGSSNREACRRFYLRAISRFSGAELERYLNRVRAHAGAYASLCHVLSSPFRHMETPLFLSSLILLVAGVVVVGSGETSVLVAGGTSAGIVGMLQCARKLAHYWEKYSIREAVFRELEEALGEIAPQA